MASNIAVYGLYRDRPSVEEAVESLKQAGFRNTDISVLLPDNASGKDFALSNSTTGAGSGAVLGGALGRMAGFGLLAIPGLGPFIAAGPVMSLLAGVGVDGAFGSLVGALIGIGLPEYEAKRFEGRIKQGVNLLSVHCDNVEWVTRAKRVLTNTGASDVASAGEARISWRRINRCPDQPNKEYKKSLSAPAFFIIRRVPRPDHYEDIHE
jgi:hypothetical protein